jgi:tetratricopeptide (TPR) repeat protein
MSFPSFFHSILPFILVLGICLSPLESAAQKSGKDELSRFDRLAEEATLLNKRGQYGQVASLLEPYKRDKKNDSALFFNELGIAYRNLGKLPEAVQAYQEAEVRARQNPDILPPILNNLGYVYYLRKEYSQAIAAYEKAVELAPRFKEAHSNLALVFYQMKKYEDALQEIDYVLRLDPNHEAAKKFKEEIQRKLKAQKR